MLSQIIRGCGDLPHVGSHPGTSLILCFIAGGAAAGTDRGGILGGLCGATLMGCVLLPMYLYGAYTRAELSDRLSKE